MPTFDERVINLINNNVGPVAISITQRIKALPEAGRLALTQAVAIQYVRNELVALNLILMIAAIVCSLSIAYHSFMTNEIINGCISIFIAGMFGHIILEKARIVITAAAFIRMFMLQYCAALKMEETYNIEHQPDEEDAP